MVGDRCLVACGLCMVVGGWWSVFGGGRWLVVGYRRFPDSWRRPSLGLAGQERGVEAAHLVRHIVLLLVHPRVQQLVEALLGPPRPDSDGGAGQKEVRRVTVRLQTSQARAGSMVRRYKHCWVCRIECRDMIELCQGKGSAYNTRKYVVEL